MTQVEFALSEIEKGKPMGFSGTATLKAETLTQVVIDLAESFIFHGFKKIVIVNGHTV